MNEKLTEARNKAWKTRRAKYGQRGHAGAYSRTPANVNGALDEISVARRQLQMLLPEIAAHKAITALDLASGYLGEPIFSLPPA